MNIATMSAQQFVNEMCKRTGTKIGSLYTRTVLPLKVGWANPTEERPDGRNPVICVREGRNSMIGLNYQRAVNRQRVREQGDAAEEFVAAPRQWGTRIMREDGTPTPFVRHTKRGQTQEKLYLTIAVRWEKAAKFETTQLDENDELQVVQLNESDFNEYSYASRPSSRQGVDKEIRPFDYTLENVHGWLHNGTYYTIVHNNSMPNVPVA